MSIKNVSERRERNRDRVGDVVKIRIHGDSTVFMEHLMRIITELVVEPSKVKLDIKIKAYPEGLVLSGFKMTPEIADAFGKIPGVGLVQKPPTMQ
jgi:hypothetical protein